jgi:hypothetical protein
MMAAKMDGGEHGSDWVRVSMRLRRRQYEELKMLAGYEGRTATDVIRQLLSIFLRDHDEVLVGIKGEQAQEGGWR